MTVRSATDRGTRPLLITASLVIIMWGMNQAQGVCVLLLVSFFLAVIGTVPVLWMERKGVPNVAAVLIVMAAMIAILMGVGVVVGASLNSFSTALPSYETRIHDILIAFKAMLARSGIRMTDAVLLSYVSPGAVMGYITALFAALGSLFSNILLILFTVVFILLEASSFPAKLRAVLANTDPVFPHFTRFVDDIKRYIVIKTLLNLLGGVLVTVWLSILGVDFPVLWGFLAFLLHFVPTVGSIVSSIPAILLALIQFGGGSAVLTAVGYLVIGMVLGNVLEPKIMGRKLGLSTLVVFVSLIFWGNLLGVVGALLCVPLTMTLKLACEASEGTRWIAVLLGPEISPEGAPAAPNKKT